MTVDLLEALTSNRVWTLDDLDDLPDDGRYEIVDGRPTFVSSAGIRHDYATAQLIGRLLAAVPPAGAVLAAGGIGVDYFNYRIADTLVIQREVAKQPGRKESRGHEIILAVEVMSPSSKLNDRVAKPAQYAGAGIPHYWGFEPEDALLIAYEIGPPGHYVEAARATGNETLTVAQPFPITLVPNLLLP